MTMYSKNGQYPVSRLPSRIRVTEDLNGRTVGRTYTAEAVYKNAYKVGYIEVSDRPAYNQETKGVTWDGSNLTWVIFDIPQEPVVIETTAEMIIETTADFLVSTADTVI